MAKKKTDDVTKFLEEQGYGAAADWKREKKFKQGVDWVRIFENRTTGQRLHVLERPDGSMFVNDALTPKPVPTGLPTPTDALGARVLFNLAAQTRTHVQQWVTQSQREIEAGLMVWVFAHTPSGRVFEVKQLDDRRFSLTVLPSVTTGAYMVTGRDQLHPPVLQEDIDRARTARVAEQQRITKLHAQIGQGLLSTPLRDHDPARNAVADRIISLIGQFDDVDEDTRFCAGKALANRIGFALNIDHAGEWVDAGTIVILMCPLAMEYYDQHLEGYISHLLPEGMGEDMESTFSFSTHQEPLKLAEELLRRGFVFDPRLQEHIDKDLKPALGAEIAALEKRLHAQEKAQHKPQRPPAGP